MADGAGLEAWPVTLEPADEGWIYRQFSRHAGGWSQADDRGEALRQAEDLLEEMILGAMAHNEDVPLPSVAAGRPVCICRR